MLQLGSFDTQRELGVHGQHSEAAFGIAADFSGYIALNGLGRLLELAQGEQQRVRQAIAYGCGQKLHGRGACALAHGRRFVTEHGWGRAFKGDVELVVLLLSQVDADGLVRHVEWICVMGTGTAQAMAASAWSMVVACSDLRAMRRLPAYLYRKA